MYDLKDLDIQETSYSEIDKILDSVTNVEVNTLLTNDSINMILITHGFGVGTQLFESLLDGHESVIQFPTNYRDYFKGMTQNNYLACAEEFVLNGYRSGYVYDIFETHNNSSVIHPLYKDRGGIFFDDSALIAVNNNIDFADIYPVLKRYKYVVFETKKIFEFEMLKQGFDKKTIDKVLVLSSNLYSIDKDKFLYIFEVIYNKSNIKSNFSRKKFEILIHLSLAVYLKKNIGDIKFILFNLHDYTNYYDITADFPKLYHFALARDVRYTYSRVKGTRYPNHQSMLGFVEQSLSDSCSMIELSKKCRVNHSFIVYLEYIINSNASFITDICNILGIKENSSCFSTTFRMRPTSGNSRDGQIFSSVRSGAIPYSDWKVELSCNAISYLENNFNALYESLFDNGWAYKKIPTLYYFIIITDHLRYLNFIHNKTLVTGLKNNYNPKLGISKISKFIMILHYLSRYPLLPLNIYFDIKSIQSSKNNLKKIKSTSKVLKNST